MTISHVFEGVVDGGTLKRFRMFIKAEKRGDAIEALKRVRDINEVME